jgi:hypothetical protein
LPALADDIPGSHAGKWKAIITLKSKEELQKMLNNEEFIIELNNSSIDKSVPYSFVVHAYSNLQFDAYLQQDSFKHGSAVTVIATLKEYDVPINANIAMWVEITTPQSNTFNLKLDQTTADFYSGIFNTSTAGVYSCKVRAEGYSSSNNKFTREKNLTACVYYGNHDNLPPTNIDEMCDLLQCLLSDQVLSSRVMENFDKIGIDFKALKDCIKIHCQKIPKEYIPKKEEVKDNSLRLKPTLNIESERPSEPIERPSEQKKIFSSIQSFPRKVKMFSLPDEEEKDLLTFPRKVKMFSLPDEEEKKDEEVAKKK